MGPGCVAVMLRSATIESDIAAAEWPLTRVRRFAGAAISGGGGSVLPRPWLRGAPRLVGRATQVRVPCGPCCQCFTRASLRRVFAVSPPRFGWIVGSGRACVAFLRRWSHLVAPARAGSRGWRVDAGGNLPAPRGLSPPRASGLGRAGQRCGRPQRYGLLVSPPPIRAWHWCGSRAPPPGFRQGSAGVLGVLVA